MDDKRLEEMRALAGLSEGVAEKQAFASVMKAADALFEAQLSLRQQPKLAKRVDALMKQLDKVAEDVENAVED